MGDRLWNDHRAAYLDGMRDGCYWQEIVAESRLILQCRHGGSGVVLAVAPGRLGLCPSPVNSVGGVPDSSGGDAHDRVVARVFPEDAGRGSG